MSGYLTIDDQQAYEHALSKRDEKMRNSDQSNWAELLISIVFEDARRQYCGGHDPVGVVVLDPINMGWELDIIHQYDCGRGYRVIINALTLAATKLDNEARVSVRAKNLMTSPSSNRVGLVIEVTLPPIEFQLEASSPAVSNAKGV